MNFQFGTHLPVLATFLRHLASLISCYASAYKQPKKLVNKFSCGLAEAGPLASWLHPCIR